MVKDLIAYVQLHSKITAISSTFRGERAENMWILAENDPMSTISVFRDVVAIYNVFTSSKFSIVTFWGESQPKSRQIGTLRHLKVTLARPEHKLDLAVENTLDYALKGSNPTT